MWVEQFEYLVSCIFWLLDRVKMFSEGDAVKNQLNDESSTSFLSRGVLTINHLLSSQCVLSHFWCACVFSISLFVCMSLGSYWLFRAWGRVGTTIGDMKVEKCDSRHSAIKKFKELYLDKTGNKWEYRKHFQKKPNKYYPLEIDYGQVGSLHLKLSLD